MREQTPQPEAAAGQRDERTPVQDELHAGDFYMENGFVVFTEAYHLRRGYCCNSGCRHCPFR